MSACSSSWTSLKESSITKGYSVGPTTQAYGRLAFSGDGRGGGRVVVSFLL